MKLKYANGREAQDGDFVVFLDGGLKVKAGVAFNTDEGGGFFPNHSIGVNVPGEIYPIYILTTQTTVDKVDPSIRNDPHWRGMRIIYHAEDAFNFLDKTCQA